MKASGDEFLTVAEIADILKLNQQTVRNWIDQGSLPALHVGRRVQHQALGLRGAAGTRAHCGAFSIGPVAGRGLLGGGATPDADGRSCRRRVTA